MSDDRKDLPPVNSPNFLEKVREALQTYLGNRGNKLDRGLTLRDLADAGIVDVNPRYLAGSGGGVPPVGGAGSAVAGAYEPDLTPPPMPTGFAATAAISNLLLACDAPTYTQGHGHAKSKLYGATWTAGPLPVFADAVVITEFQGTVASHATNPATTWHLWLTWVTRDGVESTSPAGGTNGFVVTTGQDVKLLLEALSGEITSSQLHADLGTRIDLVDDPETGLVAKVTDLEMVYGDTVNSAISAVQAAQSASNAAQAEAAAILAQGGAANSATTASTKATEAATSATNASGSAASASTSASTAATSATDAGNSAGAASTSATNAATSATNAGNSATASNSAKVAAESARDSASGSASAAATSASTASTKATDAATSASAASTSATTASTKVGEASTSATDAATSATNAAGSASSASTSATAAANSATDAGDSASAAAGSASTATTQATAAGNSATSANTAKVAAESARDAASGSASAAATSASSASTKATDAETSASAAASSATTASTKAGDASTYASNAATSATNAAGSATTASTQAGIATSAKNAAGDSAAAAYASQTASATSESNAAGSAASASSTLTTINAVVADAASAAVQTEAQARADETGALFAQYTVKTDVAGLVSGYGLASTAKNATPTSAFGVRSNQFFIAPPATESATAPTTNLFDGYCWLDTSVTPNVTRYRSGSSWSLVSPMLPFVVQTTPTTVNGVVIPAGVFMDGAYIKNLNADRITSGTINGDYVTVTKALKAADVTAGALWTGDVTSTSNTVVDGVSYPSFTINASTGLATFNNAVVRGTVYATAGQIGGITIADSAVRAGQTAYNLGSGFYLGADGRLSLGNSTGNRMVWDNTNLSIVGALTATTISTNSGNFSVNASGVMTATNGYFSGVVSAGSVDFASSVGVTLPKYTAAGTYTITAPAKMTRMRVTLYGGGGGGRAGSNRSSTPETGGVSYGGGAGGSQGARVVTTIVVSPGSTYTLVVGAGGAAGTSISDGPYYTAPAAPSGGTTYISGYVSAAGGAGGSGYSGIQPLPYGYYPGGNGGGAGGGAGGTYAAGGAGSGDGAGGGGGYGTYAIYANQIQANIGGPGAPGSALIEFFDPSGVVLRAEMDTLKNQLSAQGHTLT